MERDRDRQSGGVHLRRLTAGPTIADAVQRVASERQPFVLESAAPEQPGGRFTILGFDPARTLSMSTSQADWLDTLRICVGEADATLSCPELPFVGGWVGYVSYEAGALLECVVSTIPRECLIPQVHFALYDTVAIFYHQEQAWTLAAVDIAGSRVRTRPTRLSIEDRLTLLERALTEGVHATIHQAPSTEPPTSNMSRQQYEDRVEAAKRHIAAGDIYQVNLTQRFTSSTTASAIEIYQRLRRCNPGAYSAYLPCGDATILCSSPELFVSLCDGHVMTRPIKGTRPRVGDPVLDAARQVELLASEKDRAELTMIVDLMRNDIGRVSKPGTVNVVSPAELEAHPTVYHLVGTIESRLREGCDWSDLLRAGLPGGSITGCPKIQAMRIIDTLELNERSVYCGSIGWIGLDGSMCMNIAIRTMVHTSGCVRIYGGGAIVADSDATDEYDETLAKVRGMIDAIGMQEAGTQQAETEHTGSAVRTSGAGS